MRIAAVTAVGLLGLIGLSGCEKVVTAPTDRGVCYHIGRPEGGEVRFNVLSKEEPSIEYCAVRLFNLRRQFLSTGTAGRVTEGSYNGGFLFVENNIVRTGQTYEGPRFTLLVKAPDGRLVAPGTIVQQRETPSGPETVTIPDNLPSTQ